MAKTTSEKLTGVEEQIKQLENQRKQLLQQERAEKRKERNHRLIEWGVIVESVFKEETEITNEQIKAIITDGLTAYKRNPVKTGAVLPVTPEAVEADGEAGKG